MQTTDEPPKPRLTIRRRLDDFSGRGRSVLLLQPGCTTCCCCCLHWVGAVAGAIVGSKSAGKAEKREPLPIHPLAKQYVVDGALLGLAAAVLLAVVAGFLAAGVPGNIASALLGALAFVPSLAMLPVGAGALIGAARAARSLAELPPASEYETSCGWRFAWRIAWKTFVFSTLFSGVGYLLMLSPLLFR